MKLNLRIVVFICLVMMLMTSSSLAFCPDNDGGKKGEGSKKENYRFEISYYSSDNLRKELDGMEEQSVRKHPIHWEVALRKQLFEDTYTFYSEAAPGEFSDSKEIRKPVIYNCISRIDRYYRKLLRTGKMDSTLVSEQFCKLLDKAIILYHYDTDDFEQGLKTSKSPEAMIHTFSMVELIHPSANR